MPQLGSVDDILRKNSSFWHKKSNQAEIPKQKGSTKVARFAEVLHLRSAKHLSADAKDVAAGAGHFAAK